MRPVRALSQMGLTDHQLEGCLECRMRRVRCDKAEPECFKCRKKGIKCSGQGIECRFSSHMARITSTNSSQSAIGAVGMNNQASGSPSSSRTAKRYRCTNLASTQPQMRAPRSDEFKSSARRGSAISSLNLGLCLPRSTEALEDAALTSGTPSHQLASILDLEELDQDLEELDQSRMQLSSPRAAIQVVPAQARMFYDHCNHQPLALAITIRADIDLLIRSFEVYRSQNGRLRFHRQWLSSNHPATCMPG